MAIAYTATATTLTLVVNFRPTVVPSSHPNFRRLIEMARDPNTTEADIVPLLDIPSAINTFTGGDITVHNGRLFYRGSEVKNNLATLILNFVKSGDHAAAEPFKKFLYNCRQNPDLALVDTIYDWCVKGNMPITPDGELLAWKIVGKDWMSLRGGKRGRLRHQIGDVVSEPREECDPNRNQTCSSGIHFCSLEYLEKGQYGGGLTGGNRIIAVVINPADITAIPTDYNLSKGRCCKLRVVGEVEGRKVPDFYGNARVYGGWTDGRLANIAQAGTTSAFAVGQRWYNRNGDIAVLASTTAGGNYPLLDTEGRYYTAKGRYVADDSSSVFDLVRLA